MESVQAETTCKEIEKSGRTLRQRRYKTRDPSPVALILPTIIPITQTKNLECIQYQRASCLHIIVRIPFGQWKHQFTSSKNKISYKASKLDIRIARQNQSINLEMRFTSKSSEQKYIQYNGKCIWIETQIQSKLIKGTKKITNEFVSLFKHKIKDSMSDVFLDINFQMKEESISLFHGIINQGNTCYMNSYLQMLYHIQKFRQIIFDLQKCNNGKFPGTLQNLFFKLAQSKGKAVSTQQLSKSYGWSKKDTDVQQDIQQFSCLMLDALERKVKQQPNKELSSKLHKLFTGQLIHYVQCLDGIDYRSQTKQNFLDIQLHIQGMSNLKQSFQHYIECETLEGDNMYLTEQFGKCRAQKGIKIQSLPEVLMIHLKRFQYDFDFDVNRKILTKYEYPQNFDFSSFTKIKSPIYKLYGVLVHQGSISNSGHYYSYIKIKNKWYKFNDEVVTEATQKEVFQNNFGGKQNFMTLDSRQMIFCEKEYNIESTAYMLVYYNSSLQKQLFDQKDVFPQQLEEQKLEEQNIKNKSHEHIQISLTDWKSITQLVVSSCGLTYQTSIEDGSTRQVKMITQLFPQSQTLNQFLDYISHLNGIEDNNLTCWIYDIIKGKQALVNPYSIKDNPTLSQIFKGRQYKLFIFFDKSHNIIKSINTLENSQEIKPEQNQELKNGGCESSNSSKSMICQDQESLEVLEHTFNVEKQFKQKNLAVCVIKTFTVGRDQKVEFQFSDYIYIKKDTVVSQIIPILEKNYKRKKYKLKFYKEKKNFEAIECDGSDFLVDSTKNRLVIIIVQRILQNSKQQLNLKSYFSTQKNKVSLTLINEQTNEPSQMFLMKNMKLYELRNQINSKLYLSNDEEEADYIMIKYKSNKSRALSQAYDVGNIEQLIRYDNVIYFSKSIIKATDRESNAIFLLKYRNRCNFKYSQQVSVVSSKKSKAIDIMGKANENQIIKDCTYKDVNGSRLLLIDGEVGKILRVFNDDDEVWGSWNKTKGHLTIQGRQLRKDESFVLVVHNKTKNLSIIGVPFTIDVGKEMLLKEILELIIFQIKKMRFEFEQKVYEANQKKVRVTLYPSELSPSRGIVLEGTNEQSICSAYPCVQMFCIQIVHNSIMPTIQSMKINLDD